MEGQSSTALSARGLQQAQQLAKALIYPSSQPGVDFSETAPTHLYSSPLLRATQTADALQQALQRAGYSVPTQLSDDLQEIHPGIFQGLSWAEAEARYPALCDRLQTSRAWQPVPHAESPIEARHRALGWLTDCLGHHQPGDTVWAVSHGGLMVQLVSAILGCDRTWKVSIGHTAIFEFWLASPHWHKLTQDRFNPEYWLLRRFNDSQHLQTGQAVR